MAIVLSALSAVVACSSKSSPSESPEASTGCTDTLSNVFNGSACPADSNGNPVSYDEAITNTCATEKLKTGAVEFGPCYEYLVFEVEVDSSGTNMSKCFYDPTSHALVGVLYGDGKGQDQCGGTSATIAGGTVDYTCNISGLNGGGAGYQSCAPSEDAGEENMLLGQ
jgi:hypothetical protein